MTRYELNRLGPGEFENLVQALLKEIIADGTITFGAGPDGGREAIYQGTARYPSEIDRWTGSWIFQAKFHDIELQGSDKCRKAIVKDINAELDKITNKLKHKVDNYILATNVPLSPTSKSGTIDAIDEIIQGYRPQIQNIAVWGADDINRFLDKYPNVRTAYLHLIVPGDLIAALIADRDEKRDATQITVRSYLDSLYGREQYAQLDQAGDVEDKPVKLPKIFLELHACVDRSNQDRLQPGGMTQLVTRFARQRGVVGGTDRLPVVQLFLQEGAVRIVLIGGPGEGKSTAGQYLAQLHRAQLLGRIEEAALSNEYHPHIPRIPLRIILREFGQWLSENSANKGEREKSPTLEAYICDHIHRVTSRRISPEDLHTVVRENPTLLILDGLDEVTDPALKNEVIERAHEFIRRIESVLEADLQVLATTRPTGYTEQFEPGTFLHLGLVDLEPAQTRDFVKRWSEARELDHAKASRLESGIEGCLQDPQVQLLMKTPLQVTILVLIISAGGSPPKQREALFNDYLEVIYKRERGKGPEIITTDKELLIGLHKYIGYELQERATHATATDATLTAADYSGLVSGFIRWNDPYSQVNERSKKLRSITVDARERLVLIVESAAGRYGFELRSLQEFFAACHLVDTSSSTAQRYARFEAIARLPHWSNVALFFAGRIGRNYQGEALNIVEVCRDVDRTVPDTFLRRGASMALAIAQDRALQPNRRLQHSLLEIAVDNLDGGVPQKKLNEISDTLRSLPEEDIADHLTPIFEKKLTSLAPERLGQLITVAMNLIPSNPQILPAIDRMISNPGTTMAAMAFALDFAGQEPSAKESVAKALSVLSPSKIGGVLSGVTGFEQMACWLRVLQDTGAEIDVQQELVRRSGSARIRFKQGIRLRQDFDRGATRRTPPWDEKGVNLLLRVAELASTLYGFSELPRASLGTFVIDRVKSLHQSLHVSIIHGSSDEFSRLAGIDSADTLMTPFWILHLALGDVTPQSLEAALGFCAINRDDRFLRDSLNVPTMLTPVFEYIRSRLSSPDALQEIAGGLVQWVGLEGTQRWAGFVSMFHGERFSRRADTKLFRRDLVQPFLKKGLRWRRSLLASDAVCHVMESEPRDINYLFFAATVPVDRPRSWIFVDRRPRGWILPGFGDWHKQVDALFVDDYLTVARTQLITHVLGISNAASFPAAPFRREIVKRLLAIRGLDHTRLLAHAYIALCNAGPVDEELFVAVAEKVSEASPESFYFVFGHDCSSSSLYEVALRCANSSEYAEQVRRGACRLMSAGALRSIITDEEAKGVRYKGFASDHRRLAESSDFEAQAASVALFTIRLNWSAADHDILRRLFVSCDHNIVAVLLSQLISAGTTHERRVGFWTGLLTELLPVKLYGSLNRDVRQGLELLLQRQNQSLQSVQAELGLPLAAF